MDILILLFAGLGALLVFVLAGGGMVYGLTMQRKAVKTQDSTIDRVDYSIQLQEQGLATSKRLLEATEQLVTLQQEQNRLLEREGK